jgi:hypothetical protein
MPRVPTYDGPQVQEQATRGGYQENIDVTQGARALAAGLGDVARVVDRGVQRDAEAKANTADTAIAGGWLQWDAENRKNYQGENAGGYTAAAAEWWGKAAQTYGEKLDPMSKAMVSKSLTRRQLSSMGQVSQFVETEKEKHADNTAAANINTTIQFGVSSGDVAGASQRVRELSAQVGGRKGWTTEQVQTETLKNLSALHTAQIAKLVELPGGAVAAEAYYQANKTEIGFAQQPKVEQVLKAEVDNQFATQTAAEVAALPLGEQMAAAAKITDPARREKTIAQIKSNHALVKEMQVEQEKKFSDTAWQLVGQGKRVPEAILASMDGKERVQLQEHLRAKADRAAAGNPSVKTNPTALAQVYDMMRDDPDGFKKLRLASLTTSFSPSDIEQVARIQRDMSKPDTEKDTATTLQLASTYTGGWKPEKKAKFQGVMFDELARFKTDKKREPNFEEKRQIMDRLVLDGEVLSGSMFLPDSDKAYFEAAPAERKNFAPTITSEDRKLVRSAFEAEGVKNPTEAQVLERFKLAKGIK